MKSKSFASPLPASLPVVTLREGSGEVVVSTEINA